MCLLILLGFFILLLLALFAKSGQILLPWTISAAVLAALVSIGLGKLVGRSRARSAAISVASTIVLTFALGYAGYWLIPPTPPPQEQGLEALVKAPEPTGQDLRQMFPIHLGIAAILGALVMSRVSYVWSRNSVGQASTAKPPEPDLE
jgi:hypothetical protein